MNRWSRKTQDSATELFNLASFRERHMNEALTRSTGG
jgi:hypothetical protein